MRYTYAMSIVYENGQLSKIRYTNHPEDSNASHLYEVGTRLLFVKKEESSAVLIPVRIV